MSEKATLTWLGWERKKAIPGVWGTKGEVVFILPPPLPLPPRPLPSSEVSSSFPVNYWDPASGTSSVLKSGHFWKSVNLTISLFCCNSCALKSQVLSMVSRLFEQPGLCLSLLPSLMLSASLFHTLCSSHIKLSAFPECAKLFVNSVYNHISTFRSTSIPSLSPHRSPPLCSHSRACR